MNVVEFVNMSLLCRYLLLRKSTKKVLNLKQNRDDLSVQDSFVFVSHGRGNNNARGSPKKEDGFAYFCHSQPNNGRSHHNLFAGTSRDRTAETWQISSSGRIRTDSVIQGDNKGKNVDTYRQVALWGTELRLSLGLAENLPFLEPRKMSGWEVFGDAF